MTATSPEWTADVAHAVFARRAARRRVVQLGYDPEERGCRHAYSPLSACVLIQR